VTITAASAREAAGVQLGMTIDASFSSRNTNHIAPDSTTHAPTNTSGEDLCAAIGAHNANAVSAYPMMNPAIHPAG
jgi:hypothetical protein